MKTTTTLRLQLAGLLQTNNRNKHLVSKIDKPKTAVWQMLFSLLFLITFAGSQGWAQTNNALDFDAADDFVDIPHNAVLNLAGADFTLEAWIYRESTGSYHTILQKGPGGGGVNSDEYIFSIADNDKIGLQMSGSTASEWIYSNTSIPSNTWTHVAAVFVSGTKTVTFYLNGVADGGGTYSTIGTTYSGASENLQIGRQAGANTFNGKVDEVRLWNDQRTQKEISLNMNNAVASNAANLVAYYQMNEGIANGNNVALTTTFDLTANNHDGTLTNFTKSGTASNFVDGFTAVNNALNFDGTDDYVDCGTSVDVTATGAFTLEGWLYLNSTATNQVFFGQNRAFVWIQAGGGLRCEFFDGTTYRGNPQDGGTVPTLSAGQWYHIAASFGGTGTTVKLYINGALSTETNVINANPENVVENFSIGRWGNNNDRYTNGNIDEVRVWSVVRTCAQIKATKDVELTGGETGLIAYYNFNYGLAGSSNTNTTLYDLDATNSNNGTLMNFGALSGTTSNWVAATNNVSGNSPNLQPEINVKYNAQDILTGSTTINTTLNTFFPFTAVGANRSQTFTLENTGSGTLNISSVNSSNANFTVSALSNLAGSSSSTFTITYAPTASGSHTSTITINSNDCDEAAYTFQVRGMSASGNANALDFDGTDDYVLTASSTGITDIAGGGFSMEAWIYPTDISVLRSIVRKTGDYNLYINNSPARLDAEVWDDASSTYRVVQGPTFTTINAWTHVAFTWDGTNGKFYINGIESSGANQPTGTIGTSEDLVIGNSTIYPGNYFQGKMDEIRIWNDVRTQDEIIANMNNELTGTEANLMAYYNFNQGTAGGNNTTELTVLDASPSGNNSTNINTTGFETGTASTSLNEGATSNYVAGFTKVNNALSFNGTTDYVATALNRNAVTDFTMEAWIKYDGAAGDGYQPIIASTNQDFFIGKNQLNTDFGIQDVEYVGNINSANAFDGSWHHIAVTRSGTTVSLYIDGAFVYSGTFTGSTLGTFNIGHEPEGGGYYFNGKIDEVRIWSTVRTCAEINAYKGIELTGTETGLVAYYNFNHGTAGGNNTGLTTLPDVSTNSNTGTLTNFAGLDGSVNSGQTSNWVDGSGNNVSGTTPANQPEANVQGNAVTIVDGDLVPDAADNTEFGNVYVGTSKTVTYTIQNTGAGALSITNIALSGAGAGDYALGSLTFPISVAAGGSTTFDVTFTPSSATADIGATVTITNDDCDEGAYDFGIKGTGLQAAPGGVTTGLKLWLKADVGVTGTTAVTQWNDQSGNGLNATETTNGPELIANTFNFNPVLSFDRANSELMTITGGIFGGATITDVNVYTVSQTKSVNTDVAFQETVSTGNFNALIPGTTDIDWNAGNNAGDHTLSVAWGGNTTDPFLWGLTYSTGTTADGNSQDIRRNGVNLINDATATSFDGQNNDMTIASDLTNYWDANIGEFVTYTGALTATQQQQIESYLALKYGLTKSGDYLASDGTTKMWDATVGATYLNDIAGIGRDDASALNQKQSKSINANTALTIGLGAVAADNASNTNTFAADKKFMTWGHNNSSTNYSAGVDAGVPNAGVDKRIARVWQIQDGGVGTVQVKFDVSQFSNFTASTASEFVLLVDDDGTDFSNAVVVIGGDFTSNVVTFNGIDLGGATKYISLGQWKGAATTSSIKGNYLVCDGTGDYITVANNAALETANGTIEMWVKPDWVAGSKGANPCLLAMRTAANAADTRYSLHINDNLNAIGLYDGSSYNTVSYTFTQGKWYHVAFVESGANTEIFINGVSAGSTGNAFNTAVTGKDLSIGWSNDAAFPAEALLGKIEEVRIWNDARTVSEIRENMHLTLGGSEAGLVAYYQFNNTAGNAIDAIGGLDGTFNGNANRSTSDCPVGKGRSATNSITASGNQTFTNTGVAINFAAGVLPQGDVVVTQLDGVTAPTNVPSDLKTYPSAYWIVRNYGVNSSFTELTQLEFTIPTGNTVSVNDQSNPSNIALYKRASNSGSGDAWTYMGGASAANATTGVITFTTFTPDFTSFSQLLPGTVNSGTSGLPVTLGSFEAVRQDNNRVLVRWETISERDNAGFEVQKSENGTDYKILGFVDGAGNSNQKRNYQFVDAQASRSAYYRLKQIDSNGEFRYSPVKFVQGVDVQTLRVFPNPFTHELTLDFGGKGTTQLPVYVELYTAQGTRTLQYRGKLNEVQNAINQHVGTLGQGVYVLRVIVGNKAYIKRIMKQ